jgi:hypothetical protein
MESPQFKVNTLAAPTMARLFVSLFAAISDGRQSHEGESGAIHQGNSSRFQWKGGRIIARECCAGSTNQAHVLLGNIETRNADYGTWI